MVATIILGVLGEKLHSFFTLDIREIMIYEAPRSENTD